MHRSRAFLPLLLLLVAAPSLAQLGELIPVGDLRFAPTGSFTTAPELAWNGQWLVAWDYKTSGYDGPGWQGATRLDDEAAPLDVPAIFLRPSLRAGIVPFGDGWAVGGLRTDTFILDSIDASGEIVARAEYPVPAPPGAQKARFAMHGDVIAIAVSREEPSDGTQPPPHTTEVIAAGSTAPSFAVAGGPLVRIVATTEGFTLLLKNRAILLDRDLSPVATLLAPSENSFLDVVVKEGTQKIIASDRPNSNIDVYEVTPAGLVLTTSLRVPTSPSLLRAAYSGDTLLMAWKAGDYAGTQYVFYDLLGARVLPDGSVDGPTILEEGTDATGRFLYGIDLSFDVGGDDRGWIIALSDGTHLGWAASLDIVTRRLERNAPLALLTEEPTVASWRAVDQSSGRHASQGETTLIVWHESNTFKRPGQSYMARYGADGERLDPEDIPIEGFPDLATTAGGFLLIGSDEAFFLEDGERELQEVPFMSGPSQSQRACVGEMCLRAWTTREENQQVIRIARERGETVLDPEGVVVASGTTSDSSISLATANGDFFLVWQETVPLGTILRSAIIRTDGDLRFEISNFAASSKTLHSPWVVEHGTGYAAIWHDGVELRTMRFDSAGNSIDGGATGWTGRPTGVSAGFAGRIPRDGGWILLLKSGDVIRQYELTTNGDLVIFAEPPPSACETSNRCLRFTTVELTGDPWFHARRLFVQTETLPQRRRPVRR